MGSANPKTGQSIEFDSSSTYDTKSDKAILNYTWEFGDGNISYLRNPKYVYTSTGTFIVKLTVKDTNGYSNISSTYAYIQLSGQNGGNDKISPGIPGFEIVFVVIAVIFVLLWKKRKI